MTENSASAALLMKQYKELTDPRKAVPSFHISLQYDNIYQWDIGVMVLSEDSPYHGGYFKAVMTFPTDYPYSPPKFRFNPSIYHPNVYKDGNLCISILHRGGDEASGEADEETWSPAQSVESVLISIVSLLSSPNINSPANVDAAVDWRKDREKYDRIVRQQVEESKRHVPEGVKMPTAESAAYVAPSSRDNHDVVDEDFWYESAEGSSDEADFDDGEDDSDVVVEDDD